MQTKGKVNTKWFRVQLTERELSMRGLAKKLSLDPASVSLMLRGMRRMTNAEAHQIATIFGVPVTEILRQAGVPVTDDIHSVPLVGTVDASARVRELSSKARQQVPPDVPADGFAVQVRAPTTAADGWLLVCGAPVADVASALERFAVVTLASGERMVGTLKKGYDNGSFNIITTIPAHGTVENQNVVSASPVVWVRPR